MAWLAGGYFPAAVEPRLAAWHGIAWLAAWPALGVITWRGMARARCPGAAGPRLGNPMDCAESG